MEGDNMSKARIRELIDARRAEFEKISDAIWETPELCFKEFESTRIQREFMEKEGFRVTSPVAGMETAFIAECGSGKPVIAILGENDALANQSQYADLAEQKPIVPGGSGHACMHHILGTGGMEAVCALKTYMEENGIKGTVRYYECPAEEGGGGKVYMARAGLFDDVDAAFTWHPSYDSTILNSSLACVIFSVRFKGIAAHAAGEPWNGRDALDAVELMNTGVQYLREHILPDSRIHYSITDTGGDPPNIIQQEAEVTYCLRAGRQEYLEDMYRRVLKIAEAAAMMTETTMCEPKIQSAYADFIRNDTLDDLILNNLTELMPISYTEEELEYARRFQKVGSKPNAPSPIDTTINYDRRMPGRGSTDVADVSYCVPISQAHVVSTPMGCIFHGWTTTAVGKSSIAHKGMHTAAKMMAGCVFDLWEDPSLVEKARADYNTMLDGRKYRSMIPETMQPGD